MVWAVFQSINYGQREGESIIRLDIPHCIPQADKPAPTSFKYWFVQILVAYWNFAFDITPGVPFSFKPL